MTDSPLLIAERTLLTPYGLTASSLEGVFGTLYGHRIDDADIYFQYARSEAWMLEEGIVKSGSFNIEQGVGVRAVHGEKTAFAYSDDISLSALSGAALAVRAICAQGGKQKAPLLQGVPTRPLYGDADPIASLQDTEKVALLERLEGYARALDPRVA